MAVNYGVCNKESIKLIELREFYMSMSVLAANIFKYWFNRQEIIEKS